MGTTWTDGCRHILETTFLQAHFVKFSNSYVFHYVTVNLLKSLLIRTLPN